MPDDKPKQNKTNQSKKKKWLLISVAIFLILILALASASAVYGKVYENRIFPGIKINFTDLSGAGIDKAAEIIQKASDQLTSKGLVFRYQDKQVNISPSVVSTTDPDLTYEILSFNIDQAMAEAYALGRQKTDNAIMDFLINAKDRLAILATGVNIDMQPNLNTGEVEKILKENFSDLETPAENAKIEIKFESDPITGKLYTTNILPEKSGQIFDYAKVIDELKINLYNLKNKPIELSLAAISPEVNSKDIQENILLLEPALNLPSIILNYKDKKWIVEKGEFASWLEFQTAKLASPSKEAEKIILGFNKNLLTNYLNTIAEEINIKPQDAKFEITDGKVTQFQESQTGVEVDTEENYSKINDLVLNQKINNIELVVKESAPQITTQNANDLGIKELIGVGKSNFRGSPANRRKNIKTGADKLNGILIKPGEEFSLLKTLGEIDEANGYFPELVIKGDKTVPEFGGGLCQIGTTTFRVALDAGLPITARQNHSYRVSYYEPAGTDATIYNPWPDFKFVNDTGNNILLTTKINKDDLIFELWGAKDGRTVEQTKSRIWNIIKPPPMKEIKTTDLLPGQKKCTESAHNGADAEFTRTVTYASGEIKNETWKSHYKPWQAVCLIGVTPEELSQPIDAAAINTNTNQNINVNTN
jgi:vancomycin resistance protein YoaR